MSYVTPVPCPQCREPLWWLKFWKFREHCLVCHGTRSASETDIAFGTARGMRIKYSEPGNCLTCKVRATRVAAGMSPNKPLGWPRMLAVITIVAIFMMVVVLIYYGTEPGRG